MHVPAAVRAAPVRPHDPPARLVQGGDRPVAAGHGLCVGIRARGGALDPVRPVGGGRIARLQPLPDHDHGDLAAMPETPAAAVDEPLCHPHHGDAAGLHRRGAGGDDADPRSAELGRALRSPDPDVSLHSHVVLPLLLPDFAAHRLARAAPWPGELTGTRR